MTLHRTDVAIAGAGAVGMALAAALNRAGLRVALIERGSGQYDYQPAHEELRVYAISPGTTRFLQSLEVWPDVAAHEASAYEAMQVWESEPAQPLRFEAAASGLPWLGHIVRNDALLHALSLRLGATLRLNERQITEFSTGEQGAYLRLDNGDEVRAAVLVAADGADSSLRGQAGIDTESWVYPQRAIVANIRTESGHQRTAWQRFLPTGPLALLPLADGRVSIVWSYTQAESLLALDDAAFMDQLSEASQRILGRVVATTPRLSFPLRLLHARDYVQPGFALAGDAAHVIHPLAGQGVNLGLADAEALADVLVHAHRAGQSLSSLRTLKRYARARRADTVDMIAMTDGLYRLFDTRQLQWRQARVAGLNAVNQLSPLKDFFLTRAMQA